MLLSEKVKSPHGDYRGCVPSLFGYLFRMSCTHPNTLFYLPGVEKLYTCFWTGQVDSVSWEFFRKRSDCPSDLRRYCRLVRGDFVVDSFVRVPCGHCLNCREDKAREWALRCAMEADIYGPGVFVTLTYRPGEVPADQLPHKEAFQLFMKRFREAVRPFCDNVRFLACGEKGSISGRPHYHFVAFGEDLRSGVFSRGVDSLDGSGKLFSSRLVADCWPYGFNSVGEANFKSARYVARYGVKALYQEGSFLLMSRRPGLGVPWLRMHGIDQVGPLYVYNGGKPMPRYFRHLVRGDQSPLAIALRLDYSAPQAKLLEDSKLEFYGLDDLERMYDRLAEDRSFGYGRVASI